MKRILAALLLLIQGFSSVYQAFADDDTGIPKRFIVTAYYSPLPNQSFYLKGSYEADLLLNGNGTHGASGKEVYPGMLAAPKTYSFGTKIYLHGLGVGTVDDRGGAIVSSGSRWYDADRLDMWMWQGEEGLKRALTWGKRVVTGQILSESEDTSYAPLAIEKFKVWQVNAERYVSTNSGSLQSWQKDVFFQVIGKNSPSWSIRALQSVLSDLAYFSGELDGKYSKKLEDAIFDFQVENNLVISRKNQGAGYYGAKTRAKLQEVYARYVENERKRQEEEKRAAEEKAHEEERLANLRKQTYTLVSSFGSPKDQEVGVHVRKLQLALKLLGYFPGKDTAIFGTNTKDALIRYQKSKAIIISADQKEAGKINEATKLALIEDLMAHDSSQKTLAWIGG